MSTLQKVISLLMLGLLIPPMLWADFTFGDMFAHMKDAATSMSKEVFYDSKTELNWQTKPNSQKFSWTDAKKHCSELNIVEKSDWRLPNIDELKSLVDYNKSSPAISTTLIDIKTDDSYWSSSKFVNNSSSAWVVYFVNGDDFWNKHTRTRYVLCVSGQ